MLTTFLDDVEEYSQDDLYRKLLWFECRGKQHPKDSIGRDSYLGESALSNLIFTGKPFNEISLIANANFSLEFLYEKPTHFFFKIR